MAVLTTSAEVSACLDRAFAQTKIVDMHTHLFAPCFRDYFLYGIDEMLNYHYLISETFRYHPELSYEAFEAMTRKEQSELIWKTLFVDHTPVSEVTCSVISVFKALGLDVNRKDIDYYRDFFASQDFDSYVDRIFETVGLSYVVMTNDVLDDDERKVWENSYQHDPRFRAALRLDGLLNKTEEALAKLNTLGYKVPVGEKVLCPNALEEIRRFLREWSKKMDVVYMAASMPPDFVMTDGSLRATIIEQCVLPVCRELNLPFASMIGVKRAVNPALKLAGDALAKAPIETVEYLCSNFPKNKFLLTMLAWENQHELIVYTRKFKNLMLFGCWWFVNNPTLIRQLTSMRMEMLGTSFIPQHSDCRVFEQLVSKWSHSKAIIKDVMLEKYNGLLADGYALTEEQVLRDTEAFFGKNFEDFCQASLA